MFQFTKATVLVLEQVLYQVLETFRLSDLGLSSVSLNELETVPLNLLDTLEEVHLRRAYHLFLLSFHCMLTILSKIVLEIVTQI